MNRDIVAGNWKQLKGRVQVRWGLLIGDYLGVISGKRTQLAGERQSAYGGVRSKPLRGALKTRYPAHTVSPHRTAGGALLPTASVLAAHTHDNRLRT
jgi:uncharacterized protein YjbJ (UPF0337 family)